MNYIVRYTGSERPDADALTKILNANNVQIIDHSSLPKMLLVGGVSAGLVLKLQQLLPNWRFMSQNENAYQVPDTRRKIKK